MSEGSIILIGFGELVIAFLLGIYLLYLMVRPLNPKTTLQNIKWLLILSVVFLMLSTVPLLIVYANSLWFHMHELQIINVTIIMNATAIIVTKLMLILIYRSRL